MNEFPVPTIPSGIATRFNALIALSAEFPNVVFPVVNATLVRDSHCWKQEESIFALFGIETVRRHLAYENVLVPMLSALMGIVTCLIVLLLNAEFPKLVTVLGIVTELRLEQYAKA